MFNQKYFDIQKYVLYILVKFDQTKGITMSKYRNLTFKLASLEGSQWRATFDEIEEILQFPLPASAGLYQAWGANGGGHSQSSAWRSAGWKTGDVDLKSEMVTFYYDGADEGDPPPHRAPQAGLTIAQAKEGLSIGLGVPLDSIEIIVRG